MHGWEQRSAKEDDTMLWPSGSSYLMVTSSLNFLREVAWGIVDIILPMKTIDKLLYQCTLTRVTGIEFIKFQLWDSLFFKCPPRHKTYILRNTHRYTDRICSKNAGAPNLYVWIFALVIVANIQCRSAVVASLQAFYARIDAAIKRVLHFRITHFSTLSCSPFADCINIKLYKN